MLIIEYLKENTISLGLCDGIKLEDVVDGRGIYCKDYDALMEEISLKGLERVKNARFISQRMNIIYYIKDVSEYEDFELEQLLEKLHGK